MNVAYGVDLDGTLAEYDGWKGPSVIGKPIPKMVERIKQWQNEGITVVIFTARAEDPDNVPFIVEWLEENGLGGMDITNIKTQNIVRIYDDRAVQVEKNTGNLLGNEDLIVSESNKLFELYLKEKNMGKT